MAKKKRHWFWNLIIVLTVIMCVLAFTAHYKNWIKLEENQIKILSGIYYQKLNFSDLNQVEMVERIPSMERVNGFSAMAREKGVFKDSLANTKVYVFVDDLTLQKIRLVHHDSLQLYLNFSDSIETKKMYDFLSQKIGENVDIVPN